MTKEIVITKIFAFIANEVLRHRNNLVLQFKSQMLFDACKAKYQKEYSNETFDKAFAFTYLNNFVYQLLSMDSEALQLSILLNEFFNDVFYDQITASDELRIADYRVEL